MPLARTRQYARRLVWIGLYGCVAYCTALAILSGLCLLLGDLLVHAMLQRSAWTLPALYWLDHHDGAWLLDHGMQGLHQSEQILRVIALGPAGLALVWKLSRPQAARARSGV